MRTAPRYLVCFLLLCLLFPTAGKGQSLLFRPGIVTAADLVIEEAMHYLGTPYHWGGQTPKGFDCAGFTRYIFGKFGVSLSSGAQPQYRQGRILEDNEISKGDLVFYGGRHHSKVIGHVGIVTEVDSTGFYFIHSATSTGICISHSREPYYKNRYIGACRVVDKIATNLPVGPVGIRQELPVYMNLNYN